MVEAGARGTLSDLSELSDEDPGSMKDFLTDNSDSEPDATLDDLEGNPSRAGSAPEDAQSSAATMAGSPPPAPTRFLRRRAPSDADVLPVMDVDQLPDDVAIAGLPAHRQEASNQRGQTAMNDSDTEDPARLVPGDGMFAESSAVKSGSLPAPLKTRSTARVAPPKKGDPTSSSDDVEIVSDAPPKKGPKSTGNQAGVRPTPKPVGKQRLVATPPSKPKAVATSPAKPKSSARQRGAASPATNVSSAAPVTKPRVASAKSVASPAAKSSPASPSKVPASPSARAAPTAEDPGVNNGLSPDMGRQVTLPAVQAYLDAQSGTLAQSVLAQILPTLQETMGPIQAMMKAQQEAAAAAAIAPAALTAAAGPAKGTERAAKVTVASPAADPGLAPSPMKASPSRSGVAEHAMPIGDGFSTINTAEDDGAAKARKKTTIPGLRFAKPGPTTPVRPRSSEPHRVSPGKSDAPLSDAWSTSDAGAPEPVPVPPPKPKLPALAGKMTPVKEERKTRLPALAGLLKMDPIDEEPTTSDSKSVIGHNGIPTPGVYLEDLVKFKAKYDENCPCQVSDPELQDPILQASYLNLPGLPGDCAVVPSFTRDDDEESTMKGGRLWFSVWPNVIKNCTELTITTAVLFTRSGIFINPCRVSPAIVTSQPTKSTGSGRRLNVDDKKVATCVTAGMCLQSHVATAVKTYGPAGREHKFLHLLFHNQDWERWEAFMLSEPENGYNNKQSPEKLPAGMTGGLKSAPGSPSKPRYAVKHALAHDDIVPVYNALGQDIDFEENLTAIFDLPKWEGEIPRKSLIVVGHTTTTYEAQLAKKGPLAPHISCNLLWVVLCGLPKPGV
ncbi:hypothetical protein C8R47DRAFT_1212657 [Mycena vitilis]|nr:hypothetical protein C8R47DRAFT_1212657 [Mycena vitilis]